MDFLTEYKRQKKECVDRQVRLVDARFFEDWYIHYPYHYYHFLTLVPLLWGTRKQGTVDSFGERGSSTTLYIFVSTDDDTAPSNVTSCSLCYHLQTESFNTQIQYRWRQHSSDDVGLSIVIFGSFRGGGGYTG